jgi:hypothetical protein
LVNKEIAIILRSALNVSNYRADLDSPVTSGNNRLNHYLSGLSKLKKILYTRAGVDIYWVDNTIEELDQIPKQLSEHFESNWKILTTNTNKYGVFNKGAGDIETLLFLVPIIKNYKRVFIFESRLQLVKNKKIEKIINYKLDLLSLENKNILQWIGRKQNKSIASGCFSMSTNTLIEFINLVDPRKMTKNKEAIEHLLYAFCKSNKQIKVRKWFWHSYRIIPNIEKIEKY